METQTLLYNGYQIQYDGTYYQYLAFPVEDGKPLHDYDMTTEGTQYCGNCVFADNIADIKLEIEEKTYKPTI